MLDAEPHALVVQRRLQQYHLRFTRSCYLQATRVWNYLIMRCSSHASPCRIIASQSSRSLSSCFDS
eukprot:4756514-Amphidinium_carterae.1